MINYFVCSCIFDVFLTSTPKEIDVHTKSNKDIYLILEEESNIYICCKKNIEIYYECYSHLDIFYACDDISDPVNCFDLLYYGFENICSKCKRLILKYFSNLLVKVKK